MGDDEKIYYCGAADCQQGGYDLCSGCATKHVKGQVPQGSAAASSSSATTSSPAEEKLILVGPGCINFYPIEKSSDIYSFEKKSHNAKNMVNVIFCSEERNLNQIVTVKYDMKEEREFIVQWGDKQVKCRAKQTPDSESMAASSIWDVLAFGFPDGKRPECWG